MKLPYSLYLLSIKVGSFGEARKKAIQVGKFRQTKKMVLLK
jgi:hypothetical protein